LGKISDALEKVKEQNSPLEHAGQIDNAPAQQDADRSIDVNFYEPKEKIEALLKNDGRLDQAVSSPDAQADSIDKKKKSTGNLQPLLRFNKQRIDVNLISYNKPNSFEAEQFRMLRTNILFPKNGKPSRSIMVASTLPAEGKSFVAANLAISIAQNIDKHVLLIDCDMRSPTIHKLFGFGPVPGLSDYLTRGQRLQEVIQKTFIERLSILPGGPEPPNPAELLSSRHMTNLLTEVKQRYDDRFIIIDTPPIRMTAEAQAISKFTDGVLMVVRFGMAKKGTVTRVIEDIGKDKIIGLVGNFADRASVYKDYSSKYSSGYYGKYSKEQKQHPATV